MACWTTCADAARALLAAALLLAAAAQAATSDTTPREPAQRWLERHAPVRFAPEKDYPPFIFADANGRLDGLSQGMLRLVQQHTGLVVQALPPRPLAEQLALARAREADLLSSLRPTPERGQFLLFTQPYVRVPTVLVVRNGAAATLSSLKDQPVAVGAGYAVEAVVRAQYPAVRWQPVADDATALHGVADGRFAAAVTDSASLAYVMRRDALAGLTVAGQVGFEYALAFAVRSDWPQLRDILDDGLRSIPAAERHALLAQWLPDLAAGHAAAGSRAPRATLIGVGFVLIGLAVGWWAARRAR